MSGSSVVSYRNSTSNHNHPETGNEPRLVVSYRNSTSNHNPVVAPPVPPLVVSYRNSTSNHNSGTTTPNSALVVSYRNSTSNHNVFPCPAYRPWLYLIEILHQTTTSSVVFEFLSCCILSKFYIKPQHLVTWIFAREGCILSKFYIKPQPSGLILIDKVLLTGCLPL